MKKDHGTAQWRTGFSCGLACGLRILAEHFSQPKLAAEIAAECGYTVKDFVDDDVEKTDLDTFRKELKVFDDADA
jgi:hypothetical protein